MKQCGRRGQTLKLEKGQGKREGDWGEKIREVSAGSSGLVYSSIGMSITVTAVSTTCAVVM